jgi:anaerobic magnesium-protoporphyrin IX monomethyl ester cyclase
MHIVLWDTRKLDVSKDFAGGFGIGQYPGCRHVADRVIRWFYKRDSRPTALLYAHLAAVFARLGHRVQYIEDRQPPAADVYVFNPSLITLSLELQMMARLRARYPAAQVLVVGTVASLMPESFSSLGVTVVKGDAEQLLWRLDEVLARPQAAVQLGILEDLDRLPLPDWSLFRPERFRIGYDFWRFPTALIQASRGCPLKCNYCPYIALDQSVRKREPEAVVDEIRHDISRWGFRSFKFRDPAFGSNRKQAVRLAELIGRLPQKIQFSVESRIEMLPPDVLLLLKSVGLTCITVGIETPDDNLCRQYERAPVDKDRQREFIATCRSLGIRTVAGFLIGFPGDTEAAIRRVRDYAISIRPTFANFNVVTPYPGTQFFEEMRPQLGEPDFSRFNVYTPVLQYEHLTQERVQLLLLKCFRRYYFRWKYLRDNAYLLWPGLRRYGFGPRKEKSRRQTTAVVPAPLATLELRRKGLRTDGPHRPGR